MSESAALAAPSLLDQQRRAFLLRKLHSLSGVVPVGAFLLVHLWTNATALPGQERFDTAVAGITHLPYLPIIEIGTILLPLVFHSFYGIWITMKGRPNPGAYPLTRNWMYVMQRVTGILAFAFICFHLYEYWLPKMTGKLAPEQFYPQLCANMSSTFHGFPLTAMIYVVGIAAAVFHFANGLWGFCFSWGITVSKRSQRAAATVFGILGLVLFLLGANTAIYFATGSSVSVFGARDATTRTCANVKIAG